MDMKKRLWILAGGNGAGKSTFHERYIKKHGIKLVNADMIAKSINPEGPEDFSYLSASIAAKIIEDLISQGFSFCFETVFSHQSKIDIVARAKAQGYKIILVYIHLYSPSLNEARVKQRVSEGGHNVPVEKIHSRIPRTIKNIKTALSIVDEAIILDNSSRADPFQQVIVMEGGNYEKKADLLPPWARALIPDTQ